VKIEITREPDETVIAELGVKEWPIWECGESEFPWHYDQTEVCYVLEGQGTVTPDSGEPVEISAGDLVRYPAGMDCRWSVKQPVRKHYAFE